MNKTQRFEGKHTFTTNLYSLASKGRGGNRKKREHWKLEAHNQNIKHMENVNKVQQ